ncbi:MAG: sulfatase-like hydrolase/transferase [Oscillospiraceae bacterium]|nr:sulfatase-like hydrolase/transferase [Oscillospiraceae bacterium]
MANKKKQIIFVMCDTQNRSMLSCYDDPICDTPHWESFARDAAVFDSAFTCSPVCAPARSAIFTGLYPSSNGLMSNGMQLGANVKTVGQYLSPRGIHCGYVGKWHLDGGDYFGTGRCPDGYDPDYWYDMRRYLDELPDARTRQRSRRNMAAEFFGGGTPAEDTFARRCTDRAVDFIRNHRDQDFFLVVSYDEPHDPSRCPAQYRRQAARSKYKLRKQANTAAALDGKPDIQALWAKKYKRIPWRGVFYGYNRGMLACNRFVDDEFGRVMEAARLLPDEPLVIYTSDHGDMVKAHGLLGKGAAMYHETNNIPLLLRGGPFRDRRISTPVSHVDLLPTVLQYFGVKIPPHLEGESLFALPGDAVRRDVFAEFFRYEVEQDGFLGFQPIRNIFDGRYKLNLNLNSGDELYDLEEDPHELRNLITAPAYAAVRDGLHDRLLARMNHTRDPLRGYVWACRPWRKGKTASFDGDGFERQIDDGENVRLTYSTGNPVTEMVRKKE